jgi:hypothetical protein
VSSAPQVVAPPALPTLAPAPSKNDELTCQWTGCVEKFDTAEDLYVSAVHPGVLAEAWRVRLKEEMAQKDEQSWT